METFYSVQLIEEAYLLGMILITLCKFEADNSESMARTNSSEGNKQICTLSMWVKRTELADSFFFTAGDNADPFFLFGFYQDKIYWSTTAGVSAGGVMQTNRVFRDTSAWYHIILAIDTTQGTDTNRYKLYVNGIQETSFGTANYPSQNDNLEIMDDVPQDVGGYTSYFLSGYLAEFVAIDGQALAPTEFGEFDADSGIWKPIDVSGLTFGTNGFYLDFKDSANLGNDASGGLDFTETNITAADQATDTPTNNFCTLNPLFKYPSSQVIKEGATSGTGLNKTFLSTIGVSGGKWYAEFKPIASSLYLVGIVPDSTSSTVAFDGNYIGNSAFPSSIGYYSDTGVKIVAPSGGSSYGDSYTTNDIIGIALDMDNSKLYFSKNATWQNSGDPTSGATGTGSIALTVDETTFMAFSYDTSGDMQVNFGGYHANNLKCSK
jgi:hypothetical protein